MAIQIVILSSNSQPDGSFSVAGVFWLDAPENNVVPRPNFQSQVPYVDASNLSSLQAGETVEQSFNSGLFDQSTPIPEVQATLVEHFNIAQKVLDASNPPVVGLLGSVFDGTQWQDTGAFPAVAPVTIAAQHTKRSYFWAAWKDIASTRSNHVQFDDDGSRYLIWLYDGPEVLLCTIWKTTVPDFVVRGGYTQDQNDADKADFEANFKPTANSAVVVKDALGRPITSLSSELTIGLPGVAVLNVPEAASDLMKAWQITTDPLKTNHYDIYIGGDLVGPTGQCLLVGGEYRCRTPAVEGSALNFAIVDRNDVLGIFSYYGLVRTRIECTNLVGTVNVGDTVVGGTSSATTKILSVNGSGVFDVEFHSPFQAGEDLAFGAGATATLGSWVEGDILEVARSVKDEWIEGLDMRTVQPGGSKAVPSGMYFRVIVYNASDTDPLRIKVALIMATM